MTGEGLQFERERDSWEENIRAYLSNLRCKAENQGKYVLYGGDLNVAHEEIDVTPEKLSENTSGFTAKERADFANLLDDSWVDLYRELHPNKVAYTWIGLPGTKTRWSHQKNGEPRGGRYVFWCVGCLGMCVGMLYCHFLSLSFTYTQDRLLHRQFS